MFQVNVYVINFYSTTGCKKTFNYVKKDIKWKINFQTKPKMFPLKMIYFPIPNKYSQKNHVSTKYLISAC